MKVARARYDENSFNRHPSVRKADGTKQRFPTYTHGNPWVDVYDIEDAKLWDEQEDAIEVEWTPYGRLKALSERPADALADMAYKTKQKVVSQLDTDTPGNASESELDATIEEYIQNLNNG